jgi:hypothetical protein
VPFIGFGFIDNFIMIAAGSEIELHLGAAMGLSTMAAAGIGNLISDVAGVGLSGWIEALARRMGLPDPGMSEADRASGAARLTVFASQGSGIAVGCVLGMAPLLFHAAA